ARKLPARSRCRQWPQPMVATKPSGFGRKEADGYCRKRLFPQIARKAYCATKSDFSPIRQFLETITSPAVAQGSAVDWQRFLLSVRAAYCELAVLKSGAPGRPGLNEKLNSLGRA